MLISPKKTYVVEVSNVMPVLQKLRPLSPECIMNNKLMTRTIFEVPHKETMWLRIRTGDVDCAGNPITSASLLDKTRQGVAMGLPCSVKKSINLELTDYYNDVTFFKNMGLRIVSEQETRRTKYVCHCDGIKYTICFDIWPMLENYVFISITPATNADDEDLEGFIKSTDVQIYNLVEFPTDVDEAYLQKTSKIARDYRYLRFEV